jgi:signal transduction histidine kinase
VTLTVTNTAPTTATGAGDGTGHGLLGMRERAATANGTLTAGPTLDGGYRVVACLPRPSQPAAGAIP